MSYFHCMVWKFLTETVCVMPLSFGKFLNIHEEFFFSSSRVTSCEVTWQQAPVAESVRLVSVTVRGSRCREHTHARASALIPARERGAQNTRSRADRHSASLCSQTAARRIERNRYIYICKVRRKTVLLCRAGLGAAVWEGEACELRRGLQTACCGTPGRAQRRRCCCSSSSSNSLAQVRADSFPPELSEDVWVY